MERKEKRGSCLTITLLTMVMLMWMPRASAQGFEYPEYENAEQITVRHQGSRPTISDFATAFLSDKKENTYYGQEYADWHFHR